MLMAIKMAGLTGWALVFLGFVGALVSVACVALTAARGADARARNAGLWLAAVPMLFAAAAFGIGMIGLSLGRSRVHSALAGVDMPSVNDAILHEGYLETLYCVRIGLIAGALPALLGLAGFGIGLARRKSGDAVGPMMAPIVAGVFAAGVAATCFVVLARPLPGRDFSRADPGERDLYDAAIIIPLGRIDIGCTKLVDAVRDRHEFRDTFEKGTMRSAPLPDLTEIQRVAPPFLTLTAQCSDRVVASIEADPKDTNTPRRLSDFKTLSAGVELDARAKLYERIDKAFPPPESPCGGGRGEGIGLGNFGALSGFGHGSGAGSGGASPCPGALSGGARVKAPKIREGATSVNGRLPPEVIQRIVRQNFGRFRLCYEAGLRNNPALQGRVAVKFVIDRKGAVASAADGGSDMPDASVVSCVVRSFSNLSFPEPEGGIVTVVYPILFAPGDP